MGLPSSRKRQRPWVAATVLLTSAFLGDGVAFVGVNAEDVPIETNVTSAPAPSALGPQSSLLWNLPTALEQPTTLSPTNRPTLRSSPSPNTQLRSPTTTPIEIRKEAIPILFDLVLESSDTASLHKLTKDVDGVLENHLYTKLQSLEDDRMDVREVLLVVTLTNRRRLQGTREVVLRVDGNVLVDLDAKACLECAEEDIQAELDQLLTVEELNSVVQALEEVRQVSEVREVEEVVQQNGNRGTTSSALQQTTTEETQLQRPSTLSIVFGFILTAIAAMGLVFYAYICCRKRQKRLRKELQQRQTIEYHLPQPRITPTTLPPPKQRVSPSIPTSASTPAQDDQSDPSAFKGVDTDTVSSEGHTDDFARELQMAASLDEQAWEDFQRKKMALDRNKHFAPPSFSTIGSTSPIPAPTPESPPKTWTKSFPYGDELPEEQGVEWTPEIAGFNSGDPAWVPYHSKKLLHPQEQKEDFGLSISRGRQDPAPAAFGPSSAVLQSVEQTLSQFEEPNNRNFNDESFLTEDESECVDEVARLTRFVQRLEKRKERRMQWENTRQNHNLRQDDGPTVTRGSSTTAFSRTPQNENNGYLNNMRPSPPYSQDPRPNYSTAHKPGVPRYTGITMTGGLYQDPSLNNISGPINSMSDDSDEDNSYREDNDSLKSHERLGITPFSVQNGADSNGYNQDPISPTMEILNKGLEQSSSSGRNHQQIYAVENRQSYMGGGMRMPDTHNHPPPRLADLRTNQAIIDDAQSEANFATYSDVSAVSKNAIPVPSQTTSRMGFFNSSSKPRPPKNTNQKFSKLRSLFEERPKNAVFPPDENWQSNGMLKT